MSEKTALPERFEVVPIWQEHEHARWLVSVASDHDDSDYLSGWYDVNTDGGMVELGGVEFTPTEARALARSIMSAADHIELYHHRKYNTLNELTAPGQWPELDHLPAETQYAARVALQNAATRTRLLGEKRQATSSLESWVGKPE